jgi:hypothetical protein
MKNPSSKEGASERLGSVIDELCEISSVLQSLSILISHSTEPETILEANEILGGLYPIIETQADAVSEMSERLEPVHDYLQGKEAGNE